MLSTHAARAPLCARALLASRGRLRSAASLPSSSLPPPPATTPAPAPAQRIAPPSSSASRPSPAPLSPLVALSRQLAEIAAAAPLSVPLAAELRTRVLQVLAAMLPPASASNASSAASPAASPALLSLPPIARNGGWDAFFAQLAMDAASASAAATAADANAASAANIDAAGELERAALALVPRVRAVALRHRCALRCAERLVALQRPRAAARVLVAAAEAEADAEIGQDQQAASVVAIRGATAPAAGMALGFAAIHTSSSGVLLRRPIVALARSLIAPLLAAAACAADVHEVARLASALGFAWHRSGALLECGRRLLALAAADASAGAAAATATGTHTATGVGSGAGTGAGAGAGTQTGAGIGTGAAAGHHSLPRSVPSPPPPQQLSATARVDAVAAFACAHLPTASAERTALLVAGTRVRGLIRGGTQTIINHPAISKRKLFQQSLRYFPTPISQETCSGSNFCITKNACLI
jgi:hypothetical protein